MATLKERLIKEIEEIDDEEVLSGIRSLIYSIKNATEYIKINDEQKISFQEARKEYKIGNFHTTDDVFNELLDDYICCMVTSC